MIETESVSMSTTIAVNSTNAMLSASDLEDWAAEINSEHIAALDCAETAVEHAKRAGRLLLKAKDAVDRGDWLTWLAANIKVSTRQAQRYMQLAEANTTRVSHSSMRQALAELAAPSVPKPPPLESGGEIPHLLSNRGNYAVGHAESELAAPAAKSVNGCTLQPLDHPQAGSTPEPDGGGWSEDDDESIARAEKEYDKSMDAIMANPEMATAHAEIRRLIEKEKQLLAFIEIVERSRDQYQNTAGEVTKRYKGAQRQIGRIESEVINLKEENAGLKLENAALRRRLEVMEGM